MRDEIAALEKERDLFQDFVVRLESIYEKAKCSTGWALSTDENWDDFLSNIKIITDDIKSDLKHAETEIGLVKKCDKILKIDDVEKLKAAIEEYVRYDVQMNLKSFAMRRYDYGGTIDRLEEFINKSNK
jgi:hypothetical protein